MTELIKIQKEVNCSHCEFKTQNGIAMYDHLFHKHSMYYSDMAYAMSWSLGDNTYTWLHGDNSLRVNLLRKCDNCKKPYIAYTRKDDCDDCQKLPHVAKFLKYCENKAEYTCTQEDCYHNYKVICDCGNISEDIFTHRKHGLLTSDKEGHLRYECLI